jgi:DNA-binding CsgD family transcriptional regulator
MELYRKFFIIILVSLLSQNLRSQSGVFGQIIIDTTIWKPVIYLSIIPDFNQMNTLSNDLIIEKTDIDSNGMFSFATQFLPAEDNLYRIHISKKNAPPASLIIGGKDENHFFIIANKKSIIQIKDPGSSEFVKDVIINGYSPNYMLHQIDEIATYVDSTNFNGSAIKTELIRNAIYEKLRFFADTCSNPLVGLYALYKSNFEKNYPINQQFYGNFISKWSKERSSYFAEFRKRIPLSQNNRYWIQFLIGGICLVIGFLLSMIYFKLSHKNKNPLHDLSVQERKIFALMMEGKSNKEICEILLVGLSTVKSHVNSIYSKLGINSRKDVLNLNLDNKTNGT